MEVTNPNEFTFHVLGLRVQTSAIGKRNFVCMHRAVHKETTNQHNNITTSTTKSQPAQQYHQRNEITTKSPTQQHHQHSNITSTTRSPPPATLHTLPTAHSTLYTPHSAHYTLHSTLRTLHFTLYTSHSSLYTLHSAVHTFQFTFYTLHSALYIPHFTLYTPLYTLYTPHSTLYTSNSTLCTPPSSAFHSPQRTGTVTGENVDCSINLFHRSVLHDCIWVRGLHLVLSPFWMIFFHKMAISQPWSFPRICGPTWASSVSRRRGRFHPIK